MIRLKREKHFKQQKNFYFLEDNSNSQKNNLNVKNEIENGMDSSTGVWEFQDNSI